MALGKQLPIRLDKQTDTRLEAAAQRAGTSKSGLLRMLAQTFVDQVVGAGGIVTLPPNWSTLLPSADQRSASHRDAIRLNCTLNDEPANDPLQPRRVADRSAKKPAKRKT